MNSSSINSTPSRFLNLPLEMRRQIYDYFFPTWDGVVISPRQSSRYQGLITTNHQICQEFSSMLYWDLMIPIEVYSTSVHLLDFWTTKPYLYRQPLSTFDFRKVRMLDISIRSFEEMFKCVADLRANVLELCIILKNAPGMIEHLRIHLTNDRRCESADGDNLRPTSSFVNGVWNIEVVAQPFRILHGIRTVDIELSPEALILPGMKAWKEALQQIMMNPTPCETVFGEIQLFTATARRPLQRWKIQKPFDGPHYGPEYTDYLYYSSGRMR